MAMPYFVVIRLLGAGLARNPTLEKAREKKQGALIQTVGV